jgi:hypothetical protein
VNHYLRLAIGAALDACDSADRHTGGVAAVTVLALVIAAAAWWLLHAWNCWCVTCQPAEALPVRPAAPAPAEPDLYDAHCGTDDELLRQCRAIWKLSPRREETP